MVVIILVLCDEPPNCRAVFFSKTYTTQKGGFIGLQAIEIEAEYLARFPKYSNSIAYSEDNSEALDETDSFMVDDIEEYLRKNGTTSRAFSPHPVTLLFFFFFFFFFFYFPEIHEGTFIGS